MKTAFIHAAAAVLIVSFSFPCAHAEGDRCCYSLRTLIVEITDKAVIHYREKGRAESLREISRKDGRFVFGSVYVFVYNMKGVIIAHPVRKELIGKDVKHWIDEKGSFFRKEIILKAKQEGEGWVSYMYMDPVAKMSRQKHTFIRREGDVIFCCGFYTDAEADK